MIRDQFLALSNSILKVVSGKNYSKFAINLEWNNEVVFEMWMAEKCIAGYTNIFFNWVCIFCTAFFGGALQYDRWLIFMWKDTSKIRFDVLLGGGGRGWEGEFMENVAVTLPCNKFDDITKFSWIINP